MPAAAKKSETSPPPSFIIVRTAVGKLDVVALSDSADPALEMLDAIRKSRGRDERGKLLYSEIWPVIRGATKRIRKFA